MLQWRAFIYFVYYYISFTFRNMVVYRKVLSVCKINKILFFFFCKLTSLKNIIVVIINHLIPACRQFVYFVCFTFRCEKLNYHILLWYLLWNYHALLVSYLHFWILCTSQKFLRTKTIYNQRLYVIFLTPSYNLVQKRLDLVPARCAYDIWITHFFFYLFM